MPRLLAFLAVLLAVSPLAAQEPNKVALLVGVNNYKGTDLSNLKYAENDVAELARVLRAANFRRVVLATEAEAFAKRDQQLFPSAANIRVQLKGMLAGRRADDTVIVAFTGHGVELRGDKGLYFCPQGADLADPKTLVPLTEVFDALKTCPAGVKLMIVDACRNDPVAGKSATLPNLKSLTRPPVPKPPGGTVALFSCSQDEKSFESDKLQHGIFFHHVLQGFKGKAVNPRTGEVELKRLDLYLAGEVPEAVKDEHGPAAMQTPNTLGDIRGLVPLAKLPSTVAIKPAEPKPVPTIEPNSPPPQPAASGFVPQNDPLSYKPPRGRLTLTAGRFVNGWAVEATGAKPSEVHWRTGSVAGPLTGLAAAADGSRVYVTGGGSIRAFAGADGKELWSRDAKGAVAVVLSADGQLLACSQGAALTGVDPHTGKEFWQQRAAARPITALVAAKDVILFTDGNLLAAFKPDATFRLQWTNELEKSEGTGVAKLTVAATGDRAVVRTANGKTLLYDAATGQKK